MAIRGASVNLVPDQFAQHRAGSMAFYVIHAVRRHIADRKASRSHRTGPQPYSAPCYAIDPALVDCRNPRNTAGTWSPPRTASVNRFRALPPGALTAHKLSAAAFPNVAHPCGDNPAAEIAIWAPKKGDNLPTGEIGFRGLTLTRQVQLLNDDEQAVPTATAGPRNPNRWWRCDPP